MHLRTISFRPLPLPKFWLSANRLRLQIFHSTIILPHKNFLFWKFLMTSLQVSCGLPPPNQKFWLCLWDGMERKMIFPYSILEIFSHTILKIFHPMLKFSSIFHFILSYPWTFRLEATQCIICTFAIFLATHSQRCAQHYKDETTYCISGMDRV